MRLDQFTEDIRGKITTQDYSRKPGIDGVRVEELCFFTEDGGYFLEVARLAEEAKFQGFEELTIRQVNYSQMDPGVIKAGHVHPEQNEIFFIPPTQRFIVGLMDVREDSPTKGQKMRLAVGGGKAHVIYIPHGVAHGLSNPYNRAMHMMYFVSEQFETDPEKTQEYRIPWQEFGEDFWAIQHG